MKILKESSDYLEKMIISIDKEVSVPRCFEWV